VNLAGIKMEITIKPRGELSFDIPNDEIIEEINLMPLTKKWGFVAELLNEINLTDKQNLTDEQTAIILDFLRRTYELYSGKLLTI